MSLVTEKDSSGESTAVEVEYSSRSSRSSPSLALSKTFFALWCISDSVPPPASTAMAVRMVFGSGLAGSASTGKPKSMRGGWLVKEQNFFFSCLIFSFTARKATAGKLTYPTFLYVSLCMEESIVQPITARHFYNRTSSPPILKNSTCSFYHKCH